MSGLGPVCKTSPVPQTSHFTRPAGLHFSSPPNISRSATSRTAHAGSIMAANEDKITAAAATMDWHLQYQLG